MLLKLLNIVITILLIQCQDASNFQAGGSADPDEMSAEEEGVVPPTNISGAYLTCATEVEPRQGMQAGVVGCRLSDKDNNKIDTSSIDVRYDISIPQNSAGVVDVTTTAAPKDNRYDQLYFFMGSENSNPSTVRSIMNSSSVKANFTDENGVAKSIGGPYPSIEIRKDTIKEKLNINYEAVLIKQVEAITSDTPIDNTQQITPPPPN